MKFEQHLEDCPECLQKIAADDFADEDCEWLELLKNPHPETNSSLNRGLSSHQADSSGIPPSLNDSGARYQFVRPIGSGGAGVVWEGWDQLLQRAVAIKLLRATEAGLQETQRLLQEATALGRLSHPHIVRVHEVQFQSAQPALIMEYIAGPTLAAALHGQPCSAAVAARIAAQMAEALTHAHEHGVIHRDLKPSNVLLQPTEGTQPAAGRTRIELENYLPKIADFGLAKLLDQHSLTLSGQQLGTPSYMAPEQISAVPGSVGPSLDIYGLGAVLYELLTGRPPFTSSDPALTMAMILRDAPVPPTTLIRGTPRDLETICLKCLAKKPEHRYASMAALHADLVAFCEQRPIAARPVGRTVRLFRWIARHRFESASIGIIASLLIGLSVGALRFAATERQASEALKKANLADNERIRDREKRNKDLRLKFIEMIKLHKHILSELNGPGSPFSSNANQLRPELASAAARIGCDYLALLEQNFQHGERPDGKELWAVIESLDIAQMAGISPELDYQLQRFELSLPQYVTTLPNHTDQLELMIRLKYIRARHDSHSGKHRESGDCYMQMAAMLQMQADLSKSNVAAYINRISLLVGMRQNAAVEYFGVGARQQGIAASRSAERSCADLIAADPNNRAWVLRLLECRLPQAEWLPPDEAEKIIEDSLLRLNATSWNAPAESQQADGLKNAFNSVRSKLQSSP